MIICQYNRSAIVTEGLKANLSRLERKSWFESNLSLFKWLSLDHGVFELKYWTYRWCSVDTANELNKRRPATAVEGLKSNLNRLVSKFMVSLNWLISDCLLIQLPNGVSTWLAAATESLSQGAAPVSFLQPSNCSPNTVQHPPTRQEDLKYQVYQEKAKDLFSEWYNSADLTVNMGYAESDLDNVWTNEFVCPCRVGLEKASTGIKPTVDKRPNLNSVCTFEFCLRQNWRKTTLMQWLSKDQG